MKKLILSLISLVIFGGFANAETLQRKAPANKNIIPVVEGERKSYGEYLTTQIFSVSKGNDSKITVEYPIAGHTELVKALRNYIKDCLDKRFTGSLERPDELLKKVISDKKDVQFGDEGESLTQDIQVIYTDPSIITLSDTGYSYYGGAHGSSWNSGATFLIKNGQKFALTMLPPYPRMKQFILRGLAKHFNTTESNLSDYVFNPKDIAYPGVVIITKEGLNFLYQPYEIAPWSSGAPVSVVPVTPSIINMLTPSGRLFFGK